MDNQENTSTRALEYGGLGLFVLGAFPLVLVLTALAKGQMPHDEAGGLAQIAARVVDGFGYVPPLILCGGLCGFGIWMFLGNRVPELARHLLGLLIVGFGTAVALGAINDLWGGMVGRRTGGLLAAQGLKIIGVLAGAVFVLVAAWATWFRGAIQISKKPVRSATISDALSEKDSDGVSNAEANALVPDERTLAYMEDLWREQRELVQQVPIPPSPYPEDVRTKGKIPEGAAPLKTSDAEEPSQNPNPVEASRWRPAKAEREAAITAGEDLVAGASVAPGGDAAGADDPFSKPIAEDVEVARILATAPQEGPVAEPPSEYQDGVRPLIAESTAPFDAVDSGAGPPRPAWETASSFDSTAAELERVAAVEAAESEIDEETIEAELDALEQDGVARISLGDLEVPEDEEDEEVAELEEGEEEDEDEETAEYDEGEEEDGEEEDEETAEYEEEEDEEAAELEEGEEEDGEEEDEDEEAAEYEEEEGEEEDEEAAELEEGEEEDGEEEDEDEEAAEYEEEEGEEEDEEAAELEEGEEEDGEEEDEDEEAAEYEEEEGEEEDEEEAEEAAELEEEETEEETEPEVVLEPRPTPEGALAPEQLLRECGSLFIQEGRVAVSLLQRRFALDFDAACDVLDELQEQGLIGPYMGGQRRDILLTLEEWQARVPSS